MPQKRYGSGAWEARCGRVGVEFWRRDVGVYVEFASRVLELWRCAAGVQTWRYGARELWRRDIGVWIWR